MQLDPDLRGPMNDYAPLLHCLDVMLAKEDVGKIAVAVSGGGDSMALLHLLIRWSARSGIPVVAATVNHGLRAGAAAEAATVAAFCERFAVPHTTLHWDGTLAHGNVQAAARAARYRVLGQWAQDSGADVVALGHTADDVAETFLMRLARKSGVDGLAAMQPRFERLGVRWVRPLWQQTRADLRAYLRQHDLDWVDDPSNDDLRQTRPQARKLLERLAPFGIDAKGLQTSAAALLSARDALKGYAAQEAGRVVRIDRGDVLIRACACPPVHPEIERRLVRAALRFINGNTYDPRESVTHNLQAAVQVQGRHTAGGCLICRDGEDLRFSRELNAAQGPVLWHESTESLVWDKRWVVSTTGPCGTAGGLTVRALGDALSQVSDWRSVGLPRSSLMATPAVFQGDTLLAAPVAGQKNGFDVRIVADFTSFLLSR